MGSDNVWNAALSEVDRKVGQEGLRQSIEAITTATRDYWEGLGDLPEDLCLNLTEHFGELLAMRLIMGPVSE